MTSYLILHDWQFEASVNYKMVNICFSINDCHHNISFFITKSHILLRFSEMSIFQ